MEIHSLQQLEAKGDHRQIQAILGSARPAQNPQLWKYASAYYVRQGMAGKSLEYYSLYLKSTTAEIRDKEAVELAIECAHRLNRGALVREYFDALSTAERESLSERCLGQVAAAYAAAGKLYEAEQLVSYLRHRTGAPQLKDFDTLIAEEFGGRKGALDFISRTPEISAASPANEQIGHAMTIALAHIATGNYRQAEKVLLLCKSRVAA